ncbi:prolipoprotein diacylglyceryl transferase [Gangjinia marincola]|uniref:Phosphatidylglycerol--prolipoprotein diacylglyceryl transferase n=1 Tax=Gangjinia marincola TaxID=578463 RepID=A0ABP3XVX8_9FLAO
MIAYKFTWNPMEGIDLGFYTIHFYSLMFVVAFTLGWFLMKQFYKRENVDLDKLDPLFMYTVIATMLGARLGHVLFYQTELLWEDPFAVLLPIRTVPEFEFTGFQGLASHGAAIAIPIAMIYYSKNVLKKPPLWILDRIVITVALAGVFIRLGNFFNSEMVGKVTDSPIGVQFVQDAIYKGEAMRLTGEKTAIKAYQALTDNPEFSDRIAEIPYRYPGQLMEATGYIFVFLILMWIYYKTEKRKHLGFLFGAFLSILFTVRFIVEYFKREQVEGREDWILGLNTGQLLSIPAILAGLYFMFRPKKTIE